MWTKEKKITKRNFLLAYFPFRPVWETPANTMYRLCFHSTFHFPFQQKGKPPCNWSHQQKPKRGLRARRAFMYNFRREHQIRLDWNGRSILLTYLRSLAREACYILSLSFRHPIVCRAEVLQSPLRSQYLLDHKLNVKPFYHCDRECLAKLRLPEVCGLRRAVGWLSLGEEASTTENVS